MCITASELQVNSESALFWMQRAQIRFRCHLEARSSGALIIRDISACSETLKCVNVLLSLFISNVHLKYFKRLLSFVNTKSDFYLLITMLLNLSMCPFNGHGSTLKLSTSTISTGTLVKGVLVFETKRLYVRNLSLWRLFPYRSLEMIYRGYE